MNKSRREWIRLFVVFSSFIHASQSLASALYANEGDQKNEIRSEAGFLLSSAGRENQRFPAVAHGDGIYLTVWQEGWNGVGGDSNIRGVLLRSKPVVAHAELKELTQLGKTLDICTATDHQEAPQVAFGGGVFLVVWHDFRNGKDADTYATRVSPDGKILDPEGIPIAIGTHNQSFPVLCSDGQDFLVAWREVRYGQTYDLVAARVESRTGKVLDAKGVLIAKEVALPAVAFSGTHYVIAWLDTARTRKLQCCHYDKNNLDRVESAPVTVGHPDAFADAGQLKLISDGGGEVVALWARGIHPDPWGWRGPGAILSMRIKADGTTPESDAFNKIRWSPEGRRQYVDRLLPGVLDTAHWKGLPGWPQGKPGGFQEAEEGFWPHAYVSAVALPGVKGQYFAVWVRGHLDGLSGTGKYTLLGGRLKSGQKWEAMDGPPANLVDEDGAATLPTVSAGKDAAEGILLVYEGRDADGRSVVKGRFVLAPLIP